MALLDQAAAHDTPVAVLDCRTFVPGQGLPLSWTSHHCHACYSLYQNLTHWFDHQLMGNSNIDISICVFLFMFYISPFSNLPNHPATTLPSTHNHDPTHLHSHTYSDTSAAQTHPNSPEKKKV